MKKMELWEWCDIQWQRQNGRPVVLNPSSEIFSITDLSSRESELLFKIINQLREKGVSIIYISHRLEEVFNLSDRITILRDGKNAGVIEKEDIVPSITPPTRSLGIVKLLTSRDFICSIL